jgi:hypothetical protein
MNDFGTLVTENAAHRNADPVPGQAVIKQIFKQGQAFDEEVDDAIHFTSSVARAGLSPVKGVPNGIANVADDIGPLHR